MCIYLGRTTEQRSRRVKEPKSIWLSERLAKSIWGSVVQQLVDTDPPVNIDQAFSIICRVLVRFLRVLRVDRLQTAEVLTIKILKPKLHVQKNCPNFTITWTHWGPIRLFIKTPKWCLLSTFILSCMFMLLFVHFTSYVIKTWHNHWC